MGQGKIISDVIDGNDFLLHSDSSSTFFNINRPEITHIKQHGSGNSDIHQKEQRIIKNRFSLAAALLIFTV
jgi:hypothetical protein